MPTFKTTSIQYNKAISAEENVKELFEAHNAFVSSVSRVINNLDEENLNDTFFNTIVKGE